MVERRKEFINLILVSFFRKLYYYGLFDLVMISGTYEDGRFGHIDRVISSLEGTLIEFANILPSFVDAWSEEERVYFFKSAKRLLNKYDKLYEKITHPS